MLLGVTNTPLQVVGVDPHGSSLAVPDAMNKEREGEMYHVEGVGYDFIPTVLDRNVVDRYVTSRERLSGRCTGL